MVRGSLNTYLGPVLFRIIYFLNVWKPVLCASPTLQDKSDLNVLMATSMLGCYLTRMFLGA